MTDNFFYLDFEFHPSPQRFIDVFCAATVFNGEPCSFNILNPGEAKDLIDYIKSLPRPLTLVAYGLDSELRCLNSITKNDRPNLFDHYICLHREFKLLCNRNPEMVYGEVISKKGKIKRKFTGGKSAEGDEDKKYIHLLNALFKLCGDYNEEHVRAKEVYTQMCAQRDLEQIRKNMAGLQAYCVQDTDRLPHLLNQIWEYHKNNHPEVQHRDTLAEMRRRGAYAELIAYKVQRGYYVNPQGIVNLITNAPSVSNSVARYILQQWPEKKTFSWSDKERRYIYHADTVREFIQREASPHIKAQFKTTEKGALSLGKEVFEKLYPNRHALDPSDYLQQVYRYIYTFNSLKGLSLYVQRDKEKAPKFGNYYDSSEGVVRPHFNDFGSQTSRNQPRANGYLLLKPAWIRNLLIPPPGHCMMVSDVSQEEVLILAVLSGDMALLEDYTTGDLYTSYGLRTGAMRGLQIGTPQFKIMRQAIKAIILGIMYGKGPKALAYELSEITGRRTTMERGRADINTFWRTYPLARRFVENYWTNYRRDKYAALDSGWTMWGGNYNRRSVVNFPMQGFGAETMRAVDFELDGAGLWSPLSLHDAFMVYSPLVNGLPNLEDAAKLTTAIRQGFAKALGFRPGVATVRNDMKIIWPEYKRCATVMPAQINVDSKPVSIDYDEFYNDERAGADLEAFAKYFEPQLVH